MLLNELFDTIVFLSVSFCFAFVIMGVIHLYYKYVLCKDFDSSY